MDRPYPLQRQRCTSLASLNVRFFAHPLTHCRSTSIAISAPSSWLQTIDRVRRPHQLFSISNITDVRSSPQSTPSFALASARSTRPSARPFAKRFTPRLLHMHRKTNWMTSCRASQTASLLEICRLPRMISKRGGMTEVSSLSLHACVVDPR